VEAIPSVVDGPHLAYGNRSAGALHMGCLYVLKPDMVRSVFAGQQQAPPGTGSEFQRPPMAFLSTGHSSR